MSKKIILVATDCAADSAKLMRFVIEQLEMRGINTTRYDPGRRYFETLHTTVRFVYDYNDPRLDGILADALFGREELRDRLRWRTRTDACIENGHHGVVAYIMDVEKKFAAFNDMMSSGLSTVKFDPGKIYITTGRGGGKNFFTEEMRKLIESQADITNNLKGENTMNNVMNDLYRGRPAYLVTDNGRVPVRIDNITTSTGELPKFDGHMIYPMEAYVRNDVSTIASLFQKRMPSIKNVHFSGPVTVVIWDDGTKTMVRCTNEDIDYEKGLAMAISKKLLGTNASGSNYYDVFKKYLPQAETEV